MPISRKSDIVGLNAALKVEPSRAHKSQLPSLAVDNALELELRKDVNNSI